jgi:hypothetical protein
MDSLVVPLETVKVKARMSEPERAPVVPFVSRVPMAVVDPIFSLMSYVMSFA